MIPLYRPFIPREVPELETIIRSGSIAYGPYGRLFEDRICAFIGSGPVAVTNSFNSAVLVVLTTLDIKSGDEVIVSPMACLASTQPLATLGATVKWADIDPTTGTLDPTGVCRAITSKTKAIFHNHFCGYPGHIDEINWIGREYGIPVVDDGIEAFGSEYKGRKIGSTGADATVFSFQAVRIPTTIDGGAVIFKEQRLGEKGVLVRDCGIDRARFRDERGEISPACDILLPGHSATMSEVNSYIGSLQMDSIQTLLGRQRANASCWSSWLGSHFPDYQLLNCRKDISPNYWVYGILGHNKADTIKRFRDMGFYASGVHLNNNRYSVFGERTTLRGVDEFYGRFVALPSGWWIDNLAELLATRMP